MTEPTTALTYVNLYYEAGWKHYQQRSGLSADQVTDCKRIVDRAYTKALLAHDWSFLKPKRTIVAVPTQTTTADGVPSTVTVTTDDAFFYASMVGLADAFAFTASGNTYTLASVTSPTVGVMTADASGEADGDTITFTTSGRSRLPDDFQSMLSDFFYSDSTGYSRIHRRAGGLVREYRGVSNTTTDRPSMWDIEPVESGVTGQRWEVVWYPDWSTKTTMIYHSRIWPNAMTADGDYPIGGPGFGAYLEAEVLARVEFEKGETAGQARKEADRLLDIAIRMDRQGRPANLGPMPQSWGNVELDSAVPTERGIVTAPS